METVDDKHPLLVAEVIVLSIGGISIAGRSRHGLAAIAGKGGVEPGIEGIR